MYFETIDFLSRLPLFSAMFKSFYVMVFTAPMNGNDGQLTIATVEQAVRTWSLNQEADEIDTTNATDASTERSWTGGRNGATWTAEVYADYGAAETLPPTSAAIELIAKQGSTDKKWAFTGIILTANVVCNIPGGDAVLISYSGRADGAVTPSQYAA